MRGRFSSTLATTLVAVLLFSIASPAVCALLLPHSLPHALMDGHGLPSPNADGDEGPRDDGCGCLCCPGHAKAFVGADSILVRRPSVRIEGWSLPDEPLPKGVVRRVFHPPRA
jgi:hypothetical protein